MSFSIKAALSQGGGLLTAGAVIVGTIVGNTADPIDRAIDQVSSSPSVPAVHGICPPGWKDTSAVTLDIAQKSCQLDDWVVTLQPDGSFSHALKDGATEFVFDSAEVPGWLD